MVRGNKQELFCFLTFPDCYFLTDILYSSEFVFGTETKLRQSGTQVLSLSLLALLDNFVQMFTTL